MDTIVSDMRLRNDFVLRGYENRSTGWYVGPGYTMLGNIPNLSNAPSWWMAGYSYRAPQVLRAILPWMVIFDGTGNRASNVRVHIRNVRLYIKSRSTGQWNSFGLSAGVNGWNYAKSDLFSTSGPEDKRTNADGSVEVKPPSDTNLSWHGWWNLARVSINPDDVGAVHVTMQARLVVDNAGLSDDRSQAEYGLQVGADYYIDPATSWDVVVPAVGISRTKRLTSSWQAFNMTTLSDVGNQEPGGGISEAVLRAAPPPLE